MTFALATIRHNGQPSAAIEVDGRWYLLARTARHLLAPTPSRGLLNVFEHWTERAPALEKLADALRSGMAEASPVSLAPEAEDFLTPLQYPTKVVLMGASSYDHIAKDAPALGPFKKDEKIPTLFFKPPTRPCSAAVRACAIPRSRKVRSGSRTRRHHRRAGAAGQEPAGSGPRRRICCRHRFISPRLAVSSQTPSQI